MDGFGASLTDASAWLIYNILDEKQQKELMYELFSPEIGIGISFLRQPMGGLVILLLKCIPMMTFLKERKILN